MLSTRDEINRISLVKIRGYMNSKENDNLGQHHVTYKC